MILFIIGLLVMYFLSSAVCTVCFTQANNPPHSQSGVDGLMKPIETDNYNCLYVHLGKPSKKKKKIKCTFTLIRTTNRLHSSRNREKSWCSFFLEMLLLLFPCSWSVGVAVRDVQCSHNKSYHNKYHNTDQPPTPWSVQY